MCICAKIGQSTRLCKWLDFNIPTHRPPHRAVAVPGDWVAVALVLALQPRRQHQGHLHHQQHHQGHLHQRQQHRGHPPFSTINNGNTNTRAELNTSPPTWQDEVQLAPWVPGGQGSSQRAPLQPAWQLQAPDFGSQNPPGHKNERWRDFYEAFFKVGAGEDLIYEEADFERIVWWKISHHFDICRPQHSQAHTFKSSSN